MTRIFKRPALLAGAAALTLGLSGAAFSQEKTNTFSGTIAPLNNSGVAGTFTIEQRGQGQVRVMIKATGLEVTDQPHVAHIHGLSGNTEAMCPSMAQDDDGDGYIELAEGIDTYGPIIIPLGDVDPDNDGVVDYSATFNLNKSDSFDSGKSKADLLPLEYREIVIHGLTLEDGQGANGGEADGTAGYKTVLPVACGEASMDAR